MNPTLRPAPAVVALTLSALLLSGCFVDSESDSEAGGQLIASTTTTAARVSPGTGEVGALSGVGLRGYPDLTGLTVDTHTGYIYAVSSDRGQIVTLDPDTGAAMDAVPLARRGIRQVYYDPVTRQLLAWDSTTLDYLSIEPSSGVATVLASGVVEEIGPLAYDTIDDVWYTQADALFDDLHAFDPLTGLKTRIDDLVGFPLFEAMAFDRGTQTLIGVGTDVNGTGSNFLVRVDPDVFIPDPPFGGALAATDLGSLPLPAGGAGRQTTGLVYDPKLDRYLVLDIARDELLEVDPFSGPGMLTTTTLGSHAFGDVTRLTYDPFGGCFYGYDAGADTLVAIDPITGRTRTIGVVVGPGLTALEGLAFHALTQTLYAVDDDGRFARIDTQTAIATVITGGLGGVSAGIAFDTTNDVLYSLTSDGQLLTIDPLNGTETFVADASVVSGWRGLAFDPDSGMLLSFSNSVGEERLAMIDPATAADTPVEGFPVAEDYQGFAFDPVRGGFVATSAAVTTFPSGSTARQLLRLDLEALTILPVGDIGAGVFGLAYDSDNDVCYGYDAVRDGIVTIDPATLEAVDFVLTSENLGAPSLAYDIVSRSLFATDQGALTLQSIDVATGMVTTVGAHGFTGMTCLAFDTRARMLYGVDVLGNLVTIYPDTGSGTIVATGLPATLEGLAYDRVSGLLVGALVDLTGAQVVTIDRATGAVTPKGAISSPLFSVGGWRR